MAVHGVKKASEAGEELYPSTDPSTRVPKDRIAEDEWEPRHAHHLIRDELMVEGNSRLNLATFTQTWLEPEVRRAAGRDLRQEPDRQGRVPADGRDRAALREHPRRPLERPRRDRRAQPGTSTTGSSEACMLGGMALQRAWRARRRAPAADRSAQHRDGRQRAGLLAQVRALLGRRAAPRASRGRALRDERRRGREAVRREHHRRRARSSAPPSPASTSRSPRSATRSTSSRTRDRPRHPDPRQRGQRRLRRALHPARPGLGLPAGAREVDQRLRAQVRPRARSASAGSCGATPRTCPRS